MNSLTRWWLERANISQDKTQLESWRHNWSTPAPRPVPGSSTRAELPARTEQRPAPHSQTPEMHKTHDFSRKAQPGGPEQAVTANGSGELPAKTTGLAPPGGEGSEAAPSPSPSPSPQRGPCSPGAASRARAAPGRAGPGPGPLLQTWSGAGRRWVPAPRRLRLPPHPAVVPFPPLLPLPPAVPLASQSAQYLLSSSRSSLARMAWCCSFCFCAFSRHERVAMAAAGPGRGSGGRGPGGRRRRCPAAAPGSRQRRLPRPALLRVGRRDSLLLLFLLLLFLPPASDQSRKIVRGVLPPPPRSPGGFWVPRGPPRGKGGVGAGTGRRGGGE